MEVHYGSETKWHFLGPDFGNRMTFLRGCLTKTEIFFGPEYAKTSKLISSIIKTHKNATQAHK